MGLLDEIREGALDERTSLVDVVRRCLVVGHRLKYDPLKEWADQELNGYPSTDQVPPYRVLTAQLLGNFVIPGYRITSHHVSPSMFPEDMVKDVVTVYLTQDVAALQRWESEDRVQFSPRHKNLEAYVTRSIGPDQHCTSVWLEVYPSEITGVLSQIRNRIVEFVLNIEDEIPDVDQRDTVITPATRQYVDETFKSQIYAYNSQVFIGSTTVAIHQVDQQVLVGDLDSLRHFLRQEGVEEEDLAGLDDALRNDSDPTELKEGRGALTHWTETAARRLVRGGGNVVVEATKTVLAQAILTYLGAR